MTQRKPTPIDLLAQNLSGTVFHGPGGMIWSSSRWNMRRRRHGNWRSDILTRRGIYRWTTGLPTARQGMRSMTERGFLKEADLITAPDYVMTDL